MSGSWGNQIKITLFGESHGAAVGVILDGVPAGVKLNWDGIRQMMERRAPGRTEMTSSRKEPDDAEVLSGIFQDTTQGTPICAIFQNKDTRSRDYTPHLPRPSHADLVADIKYKGFQDYRGGGHFSGRLTAGIVFAGAIAMQILESRGVTIASHLTRIGTAEDSRWETLVTPEQLNRLKEKEIPLLEESRKEEFLQQIRLAKEAMDSIGGEIECATIGLPMGLGEPFFWGLESSVASLLFSIPAVKGVEFGSGFAFAALRGSDANDAILHDGKGFSTRTNHSGGIQGGISNAMPLIVRVAIKPTPSIGIPQQTVNLHTLQQESLTIQGRHDPCIALRAVPVVEAAVALALLDAWECGNGIEIGTPHIG